MSERRKEEVGGNLGRRKSRRVLGGLKSKEKIGLNSLKVQNQGEAHRTFGDIRHMRRASLNIVQETGHFGQSALFALNRPGADSQKAILDLKKPKNRRRLSELIPSSQSFHPYNWTNSPTYSPQVVLNLHSISSEDLDEESDSSDHQFYPIHHRSRLQLPSILPGAPGPRSPGLRASPIVVENYWSETAKVLSTTGILKKPGRKKWGKFR